ncbi:hypothetical protein [Planctopirus hydrillae]|uniref:hypothetical protein n=1 Tax=Planctopirus hydrillae TaxID=1841610 RepID=UPI001042287C|nr:hypothetical protein [Planctopirus hydrillae]
MTLLGIATATITFAILGERWGKQRPLDRFLQGYSMEKATTTRHRLLRPTKKWPGDSSQQLLTHRKPSRLHDEQQSLLRRMSRLKQVFHAIEKQQRIHHPLGGGDWVFRQMRLLALS